LVGGAIGQGDFAGAASGVATGIGGIATATSSGSQRARTGKGALAGASAGAQVGGPIGAIVGAAAGAITGFIRGRNAERALKTIQNEVGVRVSEGLLKGIRDSKRPAQLQIGAIFSEALSSGTAGADDFAREFADVFSFLERGDITKPEAIRALGRDINRVASHYGMTGQDLAKALRNDKSLKEKFRVGTSSITDYLTAGAQLITAQINRINAVYRYFRSQKEVLFSIGKASKEYSFLFFSFKTAKSLGRIICFLYCL